jgi:hypothetical protein
MTDTHYDRAPGDASALPDVEQGTSSGVLVYTTGLALAVVLTALSFWVANTSLLWAGGVSLGLTVLAIAQMSSSTAGLSCIPAESRGKCRRPTIRRSSKPKRRSALSRKVHGLAPANGRELTCRPRICHHARVVPKRRLPWQKCGSGVQCRIFLVNPGIQPLIKAASLDIDSRFPIPSPISRSWQT